MNAVWAGLILAAVIWGGWTGRMAEVIAWLPKDRLMVETDSPDQAMVRGQRNEPEALLEIAERVGKIRGCASEKILRDSAANCAELFGMRISPSDE